MSGVLKWFEDSGAAVLFRGSSASGLPELAVFSPEALADMFSSVVSFLSAGFVKDGRLTSSSLFKWIWRDKTTPQKDICVSVLSRLGILLESGDDFLVPSMLPAQPPPSLTKTRQYLVSRAFEFDSEMPLLTALLLSRLANARLPVKVINRNGVLLSSAEVEIAARSFRVPRPIIQIVITSDSLSDLTSSLMTCVEIVEVSSPSK